MQVLKIVQDVLKLIGLCSVPGKYLQFQQKIICLFVLLVLVTGMSLGSAVYIFYHMKMGEVENSLYAFFQFAAAFGDANMILAISFQREKVKKIIDELQSLYDQCKFTEAKFPLIKLNLFSMLRFAAIDTPSAVYFARANEMSLKFVKWSVWTVMGSYIISSLAYAGGGLVFFYIRDGFVDPALMYLPYKIRYLRTNSKFGQV